MLTPIALYLGLMTFVILGLLFCYYCPGFVHWANLPQNRFLAAIFSLILIAHALSRLGVL